MIGSGLKKLAKENGMKVAQGVAYGSLQGFAATMSEGSGYKQIVFATKFREAGQDDQLLAQINQVNVQRTYRVQNLNIAPNAIQVVFINIQFAYRSLWQGFYYLHTYAPCKFVSFCIIFHNFGYKKTLLVKYLEGFQYPL